MKITFLSIGKPHETYVKLGIEDFTKRISNYFPVQWQIVATPKNAGVLNENELKKKEAESILAIISKNDYLLLLDERGKQMNSVELSSFLQSRANDSIKNLVILIGGAFGVDELIQQRANFTWSISQLVFPHQLVRLILAEQVYRACTILRNEKYHHL